MEHLAPRSTIEPSSIAREETTPYLQSLRTDPFTASTVEDGFGFKAGTLDATGSSSSPLSAFLLEHRVFPDTNEEVTLNYTPGPLNFGTNCDSQTEVANISTKAIPVPLTTVCAGRQLEVYEEDVWELYKSRIRQLYVEEKKKLREVMQQMREEENFKPS